MSHLEQQHHRYDRLRSPTVAALVWGGLSGLGRDERYPYDVMPRGDREFDRPLIVDKYAHVKQEEDNRSKMTASLFLAGLVLLPAYVLWLFTPAMLSVLVAQMISGTREERYAAAKRLGVEEDVPRPKRDKTASYEDDLDFVPRASVFALAPLLVASAAVGWHYLAAIPGALVAAFSGAGQRGLRVGLRALQAVEHSHLAHHAMTVPHPAPVSPEFGVSA